MYSKFQRDQQVKRSIQLDKMARKGCLSQSPRLSPTRGGDTLLEPREERRQLRIKERQDSLVMNSRVRMQKYFNLLEGDLVQSKSTNW